MSLGIAQYVGSLAALDRQLGDTGISDDPENHQLFPALFWHSQNAVA